ncbi:2,4-dienoyl-CoA reductase [Gonapodya prolifera JEL478]|uniref:2,4-dienoyl-CoA reductase [(3E)-enoyl-CoA-producing] n=1 Tax=Gonapodya prolifera (strain JEL478) TaxID=1344416 RepID=A0A139AI43_GONPJ|nr:2,4-dienoyl-CoA reductase [Gonapodya prolifera JEL478]|eukprot:KXS16105.1 2,4-dienoyl-CoA reductase [Gonapodya prolifera JEL478]
MPISATVPTNSIFRDDILKGKVAFVTGGGSGICKGIAESYLRHGAKVTIVSRSKDRLEAAAAEMKKNIPGAQVLAVAADVRDPQQLEAAAKATADKFGRIDILICGAAGNFLAPAESLSYRAFRTVIEIDLIGTFNTIKACFPYLKRSGAASVIGISASLHYKGTALQIHPVAAKAGIDAMFKTLANEWGAYNIRCNIVSPGPIQNTEGMDRLSNKAYHDQLIARIPLRGLGEIVDIEHACLYLATDAARYVTGATLVVDGEWLSGVYVSCRVLQ